MIKCTNLNKEIFLLWKCQDFSKEYFSQSLLTLKQVKILVKVSMVRYN